MLYIIRSKNNYYNISYKKFHAEQLKVSLENKFFTFLYTFLLL